MSQSFNPQNSKVADDTLGDFVRGAIEEALPSVPGIGPATETKLREEGITSTFQLIGKFLSMKDEGVESVEHCERFYQWLIHIGTPAGFRAGIVHSIAEKMNILMPGVYDSALYDE